MGDKLKYVSTCNLNHDLVEYPKGAILTFDVAQATRIKLLDAGLIKPASSEDLANAPGSKIVEQYVSRKDEKEQRKLDEAMKNDENVNSDKPLGEALEILSEQEIIPSETEKEVPTGSENKETQIKNLFLERGYCKRCKTQVDVLNATFKKTLKNVYFIKGICATCEAKIWSSARKKQTEDINKK